MLYKRKVDDLSWTDSSHGRNFASRRKTLTPRDEGSPPKIGLSLYQLDPGKRAFPFHHHSANDEAILVVKGRGELRYGEERHQLEAGDFAYLPAGTGRAHQMINTGSESLEYYCLSSMIIPEVCTYPDSGKIATITMEPAEDARTRRTITPRLAQPVGYWDGED